MQVSIADEQAPSNTTATLLVELFKGTTDGASIAGDEITVDIYEKNTFLKTLTGKADEQGKCVFEGVATDVHYVAIARAKHQNMAFGGSPFVLSPDKSEIHAHITVYDVSTDNSVLTIGTHHLIVKLGEDSIIVQEYVQFVNDTDKAVTSPDLDDQDRPKVIDVKLPAGFEELSATSYFEQTALVVTNDGFYDTMAIPPGRHNAVYTYAIPVDSSDIGITKNITMQTSDFMVFTELGTAAITGLGQPLGQFEMPDGSKADYYSSDALKPGSKVTFQIAGLNVASQQSNIWILFTVVFAAVAVLIVVRTRLQKS